MLGAKATQYTLAQSYKMITINKARGHKMSTINK